MRPRSSRVVFNACFIFTLRPQLDAGDMNYALDEPRLFWLRKKPEIPQFEPHAGIKMAQILGSHTLWL